MKKKRPRLTAEQLEAEIIRRAALAEQENEGDSDSEDGPTHSGNSLAVSGCGRTKHDLVSCTTERMLP